MTRWREISPMESFRRVQDQQLWLGILSKPLLREGIDHLFSSLRLHLQNFIDSQDRSDEACCQIYKAQELGLLLPARYDPFGRIGARSLPSLVHRRRGSGRNLPGRREATLEALTSWTLEVTNHLDLPFRMASLLHDAGQICVGRMSSRLVALIDGGRGDRGRICGWKSARSRCQLGWQAIIKTQNRSCGRSREWKSAHSRGQLYW